MEPTMPDSDEPTDEARLGVVSHLESSSLGPGSLVVEDASELADSGGLSLTVPADARHATLLRHRLRDWLGDHRLSPDACADVLLATYEAIANVVDHAYRDTAHDQQPGLVALTARLTDTAVTVTVSDHGTWRTVSGEPSTRGRGLELIRRVARQVDVDSDAGGTTVTIRFAREAHPR